MLRSEVQEDGGPGAAPARVPRHVGAAIGGVDESGRKYGRTMHVIGTVGIGGRGRTARRRS